jgi:hypothetical protein
MIMIFPFYSFIFFSVFSFPFSLFLLPLLYLPHCILRLIIFLFSWFSSSLQHQSRCHGLEDWRFKLESPVLLNRRSVDTTRTEQLITVQLFTKLLVLTESRCSTPSLQTLPARFPWVSLIKFKHRLPGPECCFNVVFKLAPFCPVGLTIGRSETDRQRYDLLVFYQTSLANTG